MGDVWVSQAVSQEKFIELDISHSPYNCEYRQYVDRKGKQKVRDLFNLPVFEYSNVPIFLLDAGVATREVQWV